MSQRGEGLVRLSTHVFFVDYGETVEVHHGVRGWSRRVPWGDQDELLRFRRFEEPGPEHREWIDCGALVRPFSDGVADHGGLVPGTDAALADAYHRWYWKTEPDAERDYRWLGRSVVKMPTDLFFYQELITQFRLQSVLELGSGYGGGLWFFATILGLAGKGTVVGIESAVEATSSCDRVPPGVAVRTLQGDVRDGAMVREVANLYPTGFDLLIVDAPPSPGEKLAAVRLWMEVLAPGGFVIVEDVTSPDGYGGEWPGIDALLVNDRRFGIVPEAARHVFLKGRSAIARHLPSNPGPEFGGPI